VYCEIFPVPLTGDGSLELPTPLPPPATDRPSQIARYSVAFVEVNRCAATTLTAPWTWRPGPNCVQCLQVCRNFWSAPGSDSVAKWFGDSHCVRPPFILFVITGRCRDGASTSDEDVETWISCRSQASNPLCWWNNYDHWCDATQQRTLYSQPMSAWSLSLCL